ncbi:hypothetical protein [Ensifer soli]|uniref:hypothetical protein n=1 Tax=Ciceribacter sp. sgz301302 TaxID=3342379 RepID=UPI0035B96CC5
MFRTQSGGRHGPGHQRDEDLCVQQGRSARRHPVGLRASEGSHIYDYLSRRVSHALLISGVTLHSVHDLDGNVIAEYDSAGTLLREYAWLEERPLAVVADAGTVTTCRCRVNFPQKCRSRIPHLC